jgi:NADH:ubiquinone oxidoreductase subunit E
MVNVGVCIGTACHLNGSYNVVQTFRQLIEEYSLHNKVTVKACFCLKQCQNKGVAVTVDKEVFRVDAMNAGEFFKNTIMEKVK